MPYCSVMHKLAATLSLHLLPTLLAYRRPVKSHGVSSNTECSPAACSIGLIMRGPSCYCDALDRRHPLHRRRYGLSNCTSCGIGRKPVAEGAVQAASDGGVACSQSHHHSRSQCCKHSCIAVSALLTCDIVAILIECKGQHPDHQWLTPIKL